VKKKYFKNISWKVGGLLLALILWFHLATEQSYSEEMMVDIDYINSPQKFTVSDESQHTAIVKITASGKKILRLKYFDRIQIQVDLENYNTTGTHFLRFGNEQIVLPNGMTDTEIVFIAPQVCEFKLLESQ